MRGLEVNLLRPILDVLLQKPIFEINVFDRAARDIVEGQDSNQRAMVHHRHMRDMKFCHEPA